MVIMKLDRELILYVAFGVLTTVVNFVTYFIFARLFGLNYLISNILAWFFAVLFAYITNRIWVFESKSSNILKEILLFYGGRIFSGVVDNGLMYIFIELLGIGDFTAKVIIQVIVVVLNYVFSKLIVFK